MGNATAEPVTSRPAIAQCPPPRSTTGPTCLAVKAIFHIQGATTRKRLWTATTAGDECMRWPLLEPRERRKRQQPQPQRSRADRITQRTLRSGAPPASDTLVVDCYRTGTQVPKAPRRPHLL